MFVFGLQGTQPEREEETCARTNDRKCQDCPCCGKEACRGALHFTDDHIRQADLRKVAELRPGADINLPPDIKVHRLDSECDVKKK